MVADLMQPGSSSPFHLKALGSTLLFAASSNQFGTELWGLETTNQPGVTIMDDTSPNFSRAGTWSAVTEGRNGRAYAAAPGTGTSIAIWSFNNLVAGTYRIFATWSADSDRSTNARYRVRASLADTGSLLVTSVSQRNAPAGITDQGAIWSDLGTVTITGQAFFVTLNNNTTTGRVLADAIRIELVE